MFQQNNQTHLKSLFKGNVADPRGFLACRGLDRPLKPEDIGIKGVIFGKKRVQTLDLTPPPSTVYLPTLG